MRYQNLRSFQKHLSQAAPSHLCYCYLVVMPDDHERSKALKLIRSSLPVIDWTYFHGAEASYQMIADALLSPSLFGGEPAAILEDADKMSKKELQSIANLVESPNFQSYLLCAAKAKTVLGAAFEKAGVVLDLSEEKPWDKEKRLVEQLLDHALKAGKRLDSDAAPLLLERLGHDGAILEGEMHKLICYVGDKPNISRSDILRISSASRTQTLWAIAEEIIWERGYSAVDPGSLPALIPALRSQLSLGLKITSLIESGRPRDEWSGYLPKIWPKTLDKRTGQAVALGSPYFQKGLDLLFQIELLSRTNQNNEDALFDFFRCSLGR